MTVRQRSYVPAWMELFRTPKPEYAPSKRPDRGERMSDQTYPGARGHEIHPFSKN